MSKGIATLAAVLLLLFMAAAVITLAPTASADPGWDYYREVEINSGKVSGSQDLNSFPVLISLTETWLVYENTAGHVRQANGYDIVFTDEYNTTLLDYEIEEYNGTAGTLVAWVRIPSLNHSAPNTTIRLWYGNSAATDWSNAAGVWDSNYKGVWHLLGDGTTSLSDSTSNSNSGTKTAVGEPANTDSGQIGGAQVFDGTNDYVGCGDIGQTPSSYTIEFWSKRNTILGSSYRVLSSLSSGYAVSLWIYENGDIGFGNAGGGWAKWSDVWTDKSDFHHVVVVISRTSGADNARLFFDGDDKGTITTSAEGSWNDVKIGGDWNYFNGTIDEVRISASARSGDWINTTHNNQNSPSTFYSVDATATPTGGSDPVPELPTAILFAVGLVVLAGYIWLRRKNK